MKLSETQIRKYKENPVLFAKDFLDLEFEHQYSEELLRKLSKYKQPRIVMGRKRPYIIDEGDIYEIE